MKRQMWPRIGSIYLAACIVLGGASAAGAIANMLLQGLAVLIILALLWTRRAKLPEGSSGPAWIVALSVMVLLLSLVPLPLGAWEKIPPREELSNSLRFLGISSGALPLSLDPNATITSALWLLPPAAVFLMSLRMSADDRRKLQMTLIIAAACSTVLGAFQLLGGTSSSLRFYEITNPNKPVGFFANVNHQATLLLCALPLIAASAGRQASRSRKRGKKSGAAIVSIAASLFLAVGIVLTGSMAGYGLFLVSAVASVLIYRRAALGQLSRRAAAVVLALSMLFMGASVVGPLNEQRLSSELSDDPGSRAFIAKTTLRAIWDSFPAGTGLGTFGKVYPRYEDPKDPVPDFTNHAHNDYLEFVLELGLPGLLLVMLFLVWWIRRSAYAWTQEFSGAGLARAGSAIIGIVLLHSLADYPIRTTAIASTFALACALLVPPVSGSSRKAEVERGAAPDTRHLQAD